MTSNVNSPGTLPSGAAPAAKKPAPGVRRLLLLPGRLGYHAVAILLTLIFILPLAWMVSTSLRRVGLPPPSTIEWLPRPLAWQNYSQLFRLLPFGRYILNSLIVAMVAVPFTLLTASWAGFAMSQLNTRARNHLLALSIGLLMVPITALWLTRFVLFSWIGLVDTLTLLVTPALMGSSPIFVLLFYWTFRRIPADLFASARLEGANALTIWRYVAFPLARATTVAVGLLSFLLYWNDFINPLLYLKSQERYTLAVGVQQLQQLDQTSWPLLMVGCVLMILPTLLLFFIVQRFFSQENRAVGIYGH